MTKKYVIKEIKFQVAVDAKWVDPKLTKVLDMLDWDEIESELSTYNDAVVLPGTLEEHAVVDGEVVPDPEDFLGSPSLHFEIWETAYTDGSGDTALWFVPDLFNGVYVRNRGKENWFILGYEDGDNDKSVRRINAQTIKNGIRAVIKGEVTPLQTMLANMQEDGDVSHILDTDDCDIIIQHGLFGKQIFG